MLCSECSKILTATCERVDDDGTPSFRYHESLIALRVQAEAGCQLCLMFLDQLSEDVSQRLDHILSNENLQVVPESHVVENSYVKYTLDDLQSDRGTYILNLRFGNGMDMIFPRVYFVRSEGKRFAMTKDW